MFNEFETRNKLKKKSEKNKSTIVDLLLFIVIANDFELCAEHTHVPPILRFYFHSMLIFTNYFFWIIIWCVVKSTALSSCNSSKWFRCANRVFRSKSNFLTEIRGKKTHTTHTRNLLFRTGIYGFQMIEKLTTKKCERASGTHRMKKKKTVKMQTRHKLLNVERKKQTFDTIWSSSWNRISFLCCGKTQIWFSWLIHIDNRYHNLQLASALGDFAVAVVSNIIAIRLCLLSNVVESKYWQHCHLGANL